jgi:hypothetical protein
VRRKPERRAAAWRNVVTYPTERRQLVRADLLAMTESLIAEHAGVVPAGTVMRCVARSHELLMRAGVREGIVAATEAAVRRRLRELVPAHRVE